MLTNSRGGSQEFWQNVFLLTRNWVFGIALSFILFLGITVLALKYAEAAEPSGEEEYSFSWLDPDKKIYVLQNRKFTKAGHPMLSATVGTGFSNPYRNTFNIQPRLTYFMNETWGLELFYVYTSNVANPTFDALSRSAPNVGPSIREIRGQYGAQILYIPWYAKINVFNSILYFDWYFAAGAGMMQTFVNSNTASTNFQEQNLFGVSLSSGHLFHLSRSLILRFDLTGTLYQAAINGTGGETAWYSNYNIGLGLGWKI